MKKITLLVFAIFAFVVTAPAAITLAAQETCYGVGYLYASDISEEVPAIGKTVRKIAWPDEICWQQADDMCQRQCDADAWVKWTVRRMDPNDNGHMRCYVEGNCRTDAVTPTNTIHAGHPELVA